MNDSYRKTKLYITLQKRPDHSKFEKVDVWSIPFDDLYGELTAQGMKMVSFQLTDDNISTCLFKSKTGELYTFIHIVV